MISPLVVNIADLEGSCRKYEIIAKLVMQFTMAVKISSLMEMKKTLKHLLPKNKNIYLLFLLYLCAASLQDMGDQVLIFCSPL